MNIATVRLMSRILFMPMNITVLLPETIKKGKRYKVVWLLHGACGDHRTYLYSADLSGCIARHDVIVVMPSALNSDYGSYEQFGTGYDFPTYFFEELMPFIYRTFPVSEASQDNYIEGGSMGGYGAMSLGLQRPEKFAAIGMLGASLREASFLEPYENMDSMEFRKLALKNRSAFPTEYGCEEEGIKLKEINVITKYPTIKDFLKSPDCMWRRFPEIANSGRLPEIYVACGTRDLFYPAVERFRKMVIELGVEKQVYFKIVEEIGHESAFFDREIGCFMDYYQL